MFKSFRNLLFTWILVTMFHTANIVKSFDVSRKPAILPNTYIIEFKREFSKRFAVEQFNRFYDHVGHQKGIIKARLNFSSPVFSGASFYLNNSEYLTTMKNLDFVENLWPIWMYAIPSTNITDNRNKTKRQTMNSNFDRTNYYVPHIMTNVDMLHKKKYFGKGVKIAIVDSGIDYMHPAFGMGFGPGYKFSFGYDFVGDSYDGSNQPIADKDPFDCDGHGTHVSGIIGAQSIYFTGVAPNATLGMYKVFGCEGSTGTDILIAAYLDAQKAKSNIITASIGGPSGWIDDAWTLVINRIANSGIHCIVSAGNSGSEGAFYGSNGASAPLAIAVASVEKLDHIVYQVSAQYRINSGSKVNFKYLTESTLPLMEASTYKLVTVSAASPETIDACTVSWNQLPILTDSILLIKYGDCSWLTQVFNLYLANVERAIFYGNLLETKGAFYLDVGFIDNSLAKTWLNALKGNAFITLFLSDTPVLLGLRPDMTKDCEINDFSSMYPTNDLYFKPDIAAPGGSIFSTLPTAQGSYGEKSGTSMAAPYIAGVVALYLSARGFAEKVTTARMKTILLSTATVLQEYGTVVPTIKQGMGIVDAWAAIMSTTRLDIATISLNDTQNLKRTVTFKLSNLAKDNITYQLSHAPIPTSYTAGYFGTFRYWLFSLVNVDSYATVSLPFSKVTLTPNSTTSITARFSPPSGLDMANIPVYSGFISIKSSTSENLRIGYMGVAASMLKLDSTYGHQDSTSLRYISDAYYGSVYENQVIDFTQGYMVLETSLFLGTSVLRVDIIGSFANKTEAGMVIVDSVIGYPMYYRPRSDSETLLGQWKGLLRSGQKIRRGTYSLVLRALKVFGNRNKNSDYYTWTSPKFKVN